MSQFLVSTPPHMHTKNRAANMLWLRNGALGIIMLGSLASFGFIAFLNVAAGALGSVLAHLLFKKISGTVNVRKLGRSVYTGAVTALLLGPEVPFGILCAASFSAQLLAEEFFGGPGCSLFHPGLIGWMFAQLFLNMTGADITADHLFALAGNGLDISISAASFLWGVRSGTLAESSLLMLFFGVGLLVWKQAIRFAPPFLFLAGIVAGALWARHAITHALLLGPTFFIAFLVITDESSLPAESLTQGLYTALAGFMYVLLWHSSGHLQAGMYGLLVAEIFVPWLDEHVGLFMKRLKRVGA